jgi:DNA polymerase III delta prime subunit
MDEVDNLTDAAQAGFKAVMNKPNVIFIMTTNNLDQIDGGIQNRSVIIDMNVPPAANWLPILRRVYIDALLPPPPDEALEQVVKDVIEICFEYYESNVTCNRVIENLQFRREKASAKSKQATEAINKRWAEVRERNEYLKNTNGIPPVYEPNTKPIRNHTIEKEKEKEKGIDKDKLTAVYNAPDRIEIEDTNVDYMIDETEYEITKPMIDNIINKFVYQISSRFKFQSVMSEIDEDYGGFDNLIELAFPNDMSAQNNYKKQLQQYKNGIYAN